MRMFSQIFSQRLMDGTSPPMAISAVAAATVTAAWAAALAAAQAALVVVGDHHGDQHASGFLSSPLAAPSHSWHSGMETPKFLVNMEPLWDALDSVREKATAAVWRWPKDEVTDAVMRIRQRIERSPTTTNTMK